MRKLTLAKIENDYHWTSLETTKKKNRTLGNFLKMYFKTKWILKYPQFMQNYHFSDDTQTWAKNLNLQSKIAERLKFPKCLTFLGKISLNFGLFEWEKSQRFPPKTILFPYYSGDRIYKTVHNVGFYKLKKREKPLPQQMGNTQ